MDGFIANASFLVEARADLLAPEQIQSARPFTPAGIPGEVSPAAQPFRLATGADSDYFDLLSQIPGTWGWKDREHKYIFASESLAQLLGFERQQDIYGRADWTVPCAACECVESYHLQDRLVMQTLVPLRMLNVARFAGDEWRTQITTKFPLFDTGNKVVGVAFHAIDAASLGAIELSHVLGKDYSRLVPRAATDRTQPSAGNINLHKMTSKESEVLFFLLRGHNAKMIAKALDASYRTVEHHIQSLKQKFGVSSKFDLHYAAIAQGYFNFLPPSLLDKQLSIILGELDPKTNTAL